MKHPSTFLLYLLWLEVATAKSDDVANGSFRHSPTPLLNGSDTSKEQRVHFLSTPWAVQPAKILIDDKYLDASSVPGTVASAGKLSSSDVKRQQTRIQTVSSLSAMFDVTGKFYVSIDGKGMTAASSTIRIRRSTATSIVHKAYLFTATVWNNFASPPLGTILLNNIAIPAWERVVQGVNPFNQYADVTTIVANFMASAAVGISLIPYTETNSAFVDGSVLAVIFSDSSIDGLNSIRLFFGGQNPQGDSFPVTFTAPIDKSIAGTSAGMSLGISFSFQPSTQPQFSTVTVTSRVGTAQLITSSAGGFDDGEAANGALLTVGGIGDQAGNPAVATLTNPTVSTYDDELYNLLAPLNNGQTSTTISTLNPSQDDNIFFAAIFAEKINFTPVTVLTPSPTVRPSFRPTASPSRRPTAVPTRADRDCRKGVAEPVNTVVLNGRRYAVLTDAITNGPGPAYPDPCGCGYLPVPTGWSLATKTSDALKVIGLNSFNNAYVAISTGEVFASALLGGLLCGSPTSACYSEPLLVNSAGEIIAQYCDTNVLIISNTPVPSASPTRLPTAK